MNAQDIIARLGGREVVAQATASEISAVTKWEWRGFIPARKARPVAKLAADQGHQDITLDTLLALVDAPKPRRPVRSPAAQAAA